MGLLDNIQELPLDRPELVRWPFKLPDHLQLPETDGKPAESFLEHPLASLLTDSIWPFLGRLHPDGQFAIGQNSGIYWRLTEEPLEGCKAPDWFYIRGVPAELNGTYRRSYVLWKEIIPPTILLEFASKDGSEERDRTPWKGKFWVYERGIRPAYYGIFLPDEPRLEMYAHSEGVFVPMAANQHGRYSLPHMGGVELGLWHGKYMGLERAWIRWWDPDGKLLLIGAERAAEQRQLADQERQRAKQGRRAEQERSNRLANKLRELGVDPDKV